MFLWSINGPTVTPPVRCWQTAAAAPYSLTAVWIKQLFLLNTAVRHRESISISADAIGLLVGSRVAGWGQFVKWAFVGELQG